MEPKLQAVIGEFTKDGFHVQIEAHPKDMRVTLYKENKPKWYCAYHVATEEELATCLERLVQTTRSKK